MCRTKHGILCPHHIFRLCTYPFGGVAGVLFPNVLCTTPVSALPVSSPSCCRAIPRTSKQLCTTFHNVARHLTQNLHVWGGVCFTQTPRSFVVERCRGYRATRILACILHSQRCRYNLFTFSIAWKLDSDRLPVVSKPPCLKARLCVTPLAVGLPVSDGTFTCTNIVFTCFRGRFPV